MVKLSRESPLLETMNNLDREQRILMEENNNLRMKLTDSCIQMNGYTDPVEIEKMKQQYNNLKCSYDNEITELRGKNVQLESDIEASTANEVELHRMLDELLNSQKETSNFEDSVNGLQLMLDGQREVVESLTSDLALKTRLNDELRNELKKSKTKASKLEYQIEQLANSMEGVNSTKQELVKKLGEEESSLLSLKEINGSLRQEVDRVSRENSAISEQSAKIKEELNKIKRKLGSKEAECQVTKECLKKLKFITDGGGNNIQPKLTEIFKIIEVRTMLANLEAKCASLQSELEEKDKMQSAMSERLRNLENDSSQLRDTLKTLQRERDDATSKLGVLTQYYEEKEAQLKKELESQEGLLQSAEGSAATVTNRIQTYKLEISSCRSQMESLKNELEEQKQSFKIQLTNEEKKLHDSWLSARAAERRQEELRHENTQLRQKLTQTQRDAEHHNALVKILPKRTDANGCVSSPVPLDGELNHSLHSGFPPMDMDGPMHHPPGLPPPPMLPMFPGRPPMHHGMHHGIPRPPMPPGMPPHMFGPLPPPPQMPDRRLPPAGRIASPPGYDRRSYSPPGSDHSHYSDRYSPGPDYSTGSNPRGHSPDRKCDRSRRGGNYKRERRTPSPGESNEGWYNQSPQGFSKHPKSPASMDYYDGNCMRPPSNPGKGIKTSTPNDR